MSMSVTLRYDGEGVFSPANSFNAKRADQEFVVGETYSLVEDAARSTVSHRHEFAFVRNAWQNLPERFQSESWAHSEETLRKHALIQTGFRNSEVFVCASRAEVERWLPRMELKDEYSISTSEGNVIVRLTAKSQRMRGLGAMSAKEFQESKQAIIDWLADLIGTTPEQLVQARAA